MQRELGVEESMEERLRVSESVEGGLGTPVPSCSVLYQFRPVPVPWYRAVAVFLICHNMYDVDAPRAPSAHTANSAGRRFTARTRSRPR